jgi:hypothetical protein
VERDPNLEKLLISTLHRAAVRGYDVVEYAEQAIEAIHSPPDCVDFMTKQGWAGNVPDYYEGDEEDRESEIDVLERLYVFEDED